MKAIRVKNNGMMYDRTDLSGLSLAQAETILETIQPELAEVFGNYKWTISRSPGGLCIIETTYKHAGKRESFIEAIGKTPAEAMIKCYHVRIVLKSRYGWEI